MDYEFTTGREIIVENFSFEMDFTGVKGTYSSTCSGDEQEEKVSLFWSFA